MSKYEKLDAAIMMKIGAQPQPFAAIFVSEVREECERIAKAESEGKSRPVEPFRVADRRIQALRRAEKIRHKGKGWVRVTASKAVGSAE